jgi:DNA-directed RNA polymerase subunit F
MSIIEKKEITIAEARDLLEEYIEELDPLQRRVFDYTTKFSHIESDKARDLVKELVENSDMESGIAVQIVNSMPDTIPEVRTFLGRQRIISEERMNTILNLIKKYKSEE